MAKQPYIPLYIGDWEQDTNCLSLSAEAAWLKIVFKMFKDEKSGIYKTSTKALQNLWKCRDLNEVSSIIAELADNNICIIEVENGGILTFKNRRMLREKKISSVRSESVSKRYKKSSTKPLQNKKNKGTKVLHPLDNDNEYDNDNETVFKGGAGENQKLLGPQMVSVFMSAFVHYPVDQTKDFRACLEIANKIAHSKGWPLESVTNGKMKDVLTEWTGLAKFAATDKWFSTRSISDLNNEYQRLIQSKNGAKTTTVHGRTTPHGPTNGIDPSRIEREGFGDI